MKNILSSILVKYKMFHLEFFFISALFFEESLLSDSDFFVFGMELERGRFDFVEAVLTLFFDLKLVWLFL